MSFAFSSLTKNKKKQNRTNLVQVLLKEERDKASKMYFFHGKMAYEPATLMYFQISIQW